MDIVLIAGLWLTSDVWDGVADALRDAGHRPIPVALPGQDGGAAGAAASAATLDDQLDAVLAAVDAADRPVVVGHSAACTLAWLVADRRPDAVSRVVLVGGFPGDEGNAYADFFEPVDGLMAFPGWEPFEGPDSADLDAAARERFTAAAVAVPVGVSRATVHYTEPRRLDVPVTLVCPEFGPDDARGWIAQGDAPDLAAARDVSYVDIDSGHWPMITVPAQFARVLEVAARGEATG